MRGPKTPYQLPPRKDQVSLIGHGRAPSFSSRLTRLRAESSWFSGSSATTSTTTAVALSSPPAATAAATSRSAASRGSAAAARTVGDLVVGEHPGHAVGAQQQPLGGVQRQQEEVGLDPVRVAERPGDHVALRVGRDLGGLEPPGVDQLLDQAVVDADLLEHAVVEPVDARVAEVREQPHRPVVVREQRGHDGRAGVPAALDAALALHLGVLQDPRLAGDQRVADRLDGVARVVAGLGEPPELLDDDRARHVAAVVAAHPVGDDEHRRRHEQGVLVDLAHQPDVGRGPVMELDLPHRADQPGSVGGMSTTGYRTLADQLRSWPDERLSRLLHERPDLATPAPHDSGQLASRAATRSSLLRALDQLHAGRALCP